MIQPNELRIGNWIGLKNSGLLQIDIDNFSDCAKNPAIFNPIPLTPEVLEKAGFKKNQWQEAYYIQTDFGCLYIHFYNGRIITRFMSISKDSRGDKSFSLPFIGNKKSSENYIYLHHIQNLLYELTQTELNINL